MRFFVLASLSALVYAGEEGDVVVSASASIEDRALAVPASFSASYVSPFASYSAAPVWPGYRPTPSCPHNNCRSCTGEAGCYWTGSVCSSFPCWGPSCASSPAQCGGCQFDGQCGVGGRCENGQCVGDAGDRACDYYRDCAGCLSRPNCLWDPNTLGGSCKPKEQCDFTYQQRELVFAAAAAAPPASACVRTLDRCNQRDFSGTPLDLNTERGIGCTNHGQCGRDQYCFSCSKCVGNCGGCRRPGAVPVSGMCGPAYRCPIDNDSISSTCPAQSPSWPSPSWPSPSWPSPSWPYPSYPSYPSQPSSCLYYSCSSCTAAYGCIWTGTSCIYATSPCTNYGCANTPDQCFGGIVAPPVTSSCNYYSCAPCTAAYGCVWSGTSCYYTTTPCYTPGCANTPSQCSVFSPVYPVTPVYPTYPTVPYFPPSSSSCDYYTSCYSCLSNPACLWDPNSFTHCKPKEQCDFTYRGLSLASASVAAAPPATACVRTVDRCSQIDFSGSVLNPNYERGTGCTNHGQCLPGQYCFSCSKCRGACQPCFQPGFPASGGCGPVSRCPIDLDSINGLCPVA